MRISPAAPAALLLSVASLCAQPTAPSPQQLARIRALAQPHALTATPLTVDIDSREEVRQFYRAIYGASDGVAMQWTGSLDTGDAGDTSAAFKAATLLRINFFRALAGVSPSVTLNSAYSAKAQQAALMMSANTALSHNPPNTWTFYTADGAEAAGNSNISLGSAGPDAITGYMLDGGDNNAVVGHRRWLCYPQTQQMGTGDVPGDETHFAANATWIIDANFGGPRPSTRTTGIAYPPAGKVPFPLVPQRWSFSYPGADFSSATVTATQGGQPVTVASTLASNANAGIGEPAVIWVFDGHDANSNDPFDRPVADTTYAVTVHHVLVSGVPQDFSYNVTVFDPDVPGSDYVPVAVTGNAHPVVGTAATYAIAQPAFASGVEWRSLQLTAFTKIYNAEAGIDDLVATTAGGYAMVESGVVGAGTASYNLAHSAFASEYLAFPATYYVGPNAAISFLSRLGLAKADETALLQISADDGVSWSDLFEQVGTGDAGESSFTTQNLS
ncbi:MAG TPA: CAP domain-containing protein, partial [Opitutus sp.]|nr:CAP domain-containing protein [Opitutus sp.]